MGYVRRLSPLVKAMHLYPFTPRRGMGYVRRLSPLVKAMHLYPFTPRRGMGYVRRQRRRGAITVGNPCIEDAPPE